MCSSLSIGILVQVIYYGQNYHRWVALTFVSHFVGGDINEAFGKHLEELTAVLDPWGPSKGMCLFIVTCWVSVFLKCFITTGV